MKNILSIVMLLVCGIALHAQTVPSPQQTDQIITDPNGNNKADPGDKIRYKVTIQNTGGGTATGTTLNAVPDAKTTFTAGSFRSSPLAIDDAYTCIGNVGITVPDGASDLLGNDFDDAPAGLTASSGTFGTTQGGSITIAANGSFTYNPPRGYEGSDTYIYTVNDGNGVGGGVPTTSTATVTITVSGMIWFINNNAGACASSCDGRMSNPYTTLADFNTANALAGGLNPDNNDNIFIYESAANYTGGITLRSGQKLFGQDATVTLNVATGLSQPTFGNALPVTNSANGTIVSITNAGGAGITLNSNNTIRGLLVSTTTGAKIFGSNFGTLTVGNATAPDVTLGGNGQALSLTTGSFAATSKFISVASFFSTSHGLFLSDVDGTVAMGSTTISGSTSLCILVQGGSTANVDFGNTTLTGGAGGVSLQSNSGGTRTFGTLSTLNCSGAAFENINGGGLTNVTGSTTIANPGDRGINIGNTTAGNGVTFADVVIIGSGSVGADLNDNAGDITFTSLNITPDNGQPALEVTNQTGTLTTTSGTISATSANCIDINNAVLAVTLTSVTANGGNIGVGLSQCSGTFTANGGSIANQAVGGFVVSAGTVTVTYSGGFGNGVKSIEINNHDSNNITFQTGTINSNGRVIVQDCNGGVITFANPTKTLSTGANTAVTLANNTGATINFTNGGLAITTTSGTGFNATGGATAVTVQGTGNTISSGSGTALNVANTTIGASGLNFQSISANGGANGIVLNNTGSSGGLTVTGNGGTCSSVGTCTGGAIQNTSGNGIRLINTQHVSLNQMAISNTTGSGIKGTGNVVNFTFTNGFITNSNDAATDGTNTTDEANIAFNDNQGGTEQNLTGTVIITGNTLTNAQYHGVDIFNYNGTISDANISNNTITSSTVATSSQGSGIRLIAFGSATTAANVTKATIANNIISNFPSGTGIMAQGGTANAAGPAGVFGTAGSPTNIISITGNRVAGQSAANRLGTQAILGTVNGRGQGNFDISDNGTLANPLTNTLGTTIAVSSFGFANVTATVNRNVIVSNNTVGSQGIGVGTGITFTNGDTPTLTISLNNNNISQTDGNGILAVARDCSGDLNITIKNNTVAAPLGGVRPGIRIDAGNTNSADDDVCLDISGNTSAGSGDPTTTKAPGIGLRKQGTSTTTNAFGIEGMSATVTPNVEAYINGLNPGSASGGPTSGGVGGTLLISATSGFSNCNTAPN